jgi:phosphatidylinositol alpha-1,6-mannosyltransferase
VWRRLDVRPWLAGASNLASDLRPEWRAPGLLAGGPVNYVGAMSATAGGSDGRRVRVPRLLVITPDFPPARGGIQVLVHRLVTGLQGFDTRVVTLDGPGADQFDVTTGLRIRRVWSDGRLRGARNVALNTRALSEARSFRPDVTLSAHIVASPAAAAIRGVLGARTVQYFYAKEISHRPRLAAFAARRADASISISTYTSGLLAALGVPDGALTLIPPGVDLPADPRRQAAERPTLLTISRLKDRYKGHDVLMRSLVSIREQVPDVQWIVIGDGPLRPELEALAGSLMLADCIRFLGSVSDEERNSWLRRADVLAMPSRLPDGHRGGEGFGIVYLEAGAYGMPVLAGNVAGAVDAVSDGETGLLVDPTDAAAVAAAGTRLLRDRVLAARLGAAGAERARRFAWPQIVEQVRAVLLAQLSEPGEPGFGGAPEHDSSRRTAA